MSAGPRREVICPFGILGRFLWIWVARVIDSDGQTDIDRCRDVAGRIAKDIFKCSLIDAADESKPFPVWLRNHARGLKCVRERGIDTALRLKPGKDVLVVVGGPAEEVFAKGEGWPLH